LEDNKVDDIQDANRENRVNRTEKEINRFRPTQIFVHITLPDQTEKFYIATSADRKTLYFVDTNSDRLGEYQYWVISGELSKICPADTTTNLTPEQLQEKIYQERVKAIVKEYVKLIQAGIIPTGHLTSRGRYALERHGRFGPPQKQPPAADLPGPVQDIKRPPIIQSAQPLAQLQAKVKISAPTQALPNRIQNFHYAGSVKSSEYVPPHIRGAAYTAKVRQDIVAKENSMVEMMARLKIDEEIARRI
jgi:hypothetical protein